MLCDKIVLVRMKGKVFQDGGETSYVVWPKETVMWSGRAKDIVVLSGSDKDGQDQK